ncbi:MAG TPA: Fur family transcriptional regulator [Candidatus Deferrimicrobiaceae bacterium]|nr:Fur family transcriptional regulator [Candidatus Deferrimicrobiaceae bacterium]
MTRAAARPRSTRTPDRWATLKRRLRERGLRWTPQRRAVVEVLSGVHGHVTGAELVAGCRAIDPTTTPSTVYRTLDVLEEIGLVSHSHGLEGRQEFHIRPAALHGHLACSGCGTTWELRPDEAATLLHSLRRRRGFEVALDHLTVVGLCDACRER